jgi:hypothetical protein
MQTLTWAPNHRLHPVAARGKETLNQAFRAEFGVNITIIDN